MWAAKQNKDYFSSINETQASHQGKKYDKILYYRQIVVRLCAKPAVNDLSNTVENTALLYSSVRLFSPRL